MDFRMTTTTNDAKVERRWMALIVLCVSIAILAMDTTIVNVAVPEIQTSLSASASSMQWIIDSYYLVFAGLLLTMGALGDRFGRRRLLQVGMACFAGASLLAAFAGSSEQLIIARALTGIGAATVTPATLSIIVDTFPANERAKAIAIWSAAAGIGVPLGQIVAGALLTTFWWGAIFFINVPVCLFVLGGSMTVVSESRDPAARPIDPVGAALSTGMLSLFVFGIIEAPSRGWENPLILGAIGLSLFVGAAFVLYELRARIPMLDIRLLRNAGLSMGAVALTAVFLVMLGMMFLFTQYLQIARGHSALETGLLMSPLPAGFAVGSALSERASISLGANRVIAFGLALAAAALGLLSLVDVDTSMWLIEAVILVFGLGGGIVMAPATAIMMASVPETSAGVGGALNEATRIIGIALGVSILGSISNSVYASHVRDATQGLALPPGYDDSIGAAAQIAGQLGGPLGGSLTAAAQGAFVDAFSVAMIAGAIVAIVGAAVVLRWMPARMPEQTLEETPVVAVEADPAA
jgi:EmrB/QacA subfamily drug resistance transporter